MKKELIENPSRMHPADMQMQRSLRDRVTVKFLDHLTQKKHRAHIILILNCIRDNQIIIRLTFPDILDDMIHLINHEIGGYESNKLSRFHEWSVTRFTNTTLLVFTSLDV
jgi:hypothetical protein